jgi:hypothetical protein
MKTAMPVSMASLFIGACLAFGQSANDVPPASSDKPATELLPAKPIDFGCGGGADCSPLPGPGCRLVTAEFEYLLWTFPKRSDPFISDASNRLDVSGTIIQRTLGEEALSKHIQSGARFTLGYWLTEPNIWTARNEIQCLGVEGRFFFVGQQSRAIEDSTSPAIVRPFFDVNDHHESFLPIAAPGYGAGIITALAKHDMWGAELSLWKNLYYNPLGTVFGVYGLCGFRYVGFDSDVEIHTVSVVNSTITNPGLGDFASLAGSRIDAAEAFTTHNNFYGAEFGVRFEWNTQLMILDTDIRFAIGSTEEDLNIVGTQTRTVGTTATTSLGDLLALPSNIGQHHKSQFSQIPEIDVKLKFPVANHLTLTTGFSALYWTHVARASEQIDRQIDISQIPNFPPGAGVPSTGLGVPAVLFRQTELFLVGISAGAEFRW